MSLLVKKDELEYGTEFSSIFKIEEKSILKPCLSDTGREEIRRIRAKALEIERRCTEKKERLAASLAAKENALVLDAESGSNSDQTTDNEIDNLATSISEWDISSIPGGTDHDPVTVSLCSELLDDGNQYQDTFVKAQHTQPLIRSNSFTVDEPSKCFLKHLEDNGVVSNYTSTITESLNKTKVVFKEPVKRKIENKKVTTPKVKKYPTKLFSIKKGRISSDNISNLPEKVIRKNQSKTSNTPELRKERTVSKSNLLIGTTNRMQNTLISSRESSFTQAPIPSSEVTNENTIEQRILEMMGNIEEKYQTEIMLFLEKQKRDQDAFLRKVMSDIRAKQETFQQNIVAHLKALIEENVSKVIFNRITEPDANAITKNMTNTTNDLNGNVSISSKQADMHDAITKINACVRGYLARRLFKTEHVQQIVKTIRDSQYLVIDLHVEDIEDESAADIQLKHNLLQQLRSNKDNLSAIFTNTIADRCRVIQFDRQMIKLRLIQSNVRNNNTAKEFSNDQYAVSNSLENKLKKLKIVKL